VSLSMRVVLVVRGGAARACWTALGLPLLEDSGRTASQCQRQCLEHPFSPIRKPALAQQHAQAMLGQECPPVAPPAPLAPRLPDSADQPLKRQRFDGLAIRGRRRRLTPDEVDCLLGMRCPGGTLQYHLATKGIPHGPETLEDILSWPVPMVHNYLFTPGSASAVRRSRLLSLWEDGIMVHSDCSGKLTPEAALVLLKHCLHKDGVRFPEEVLFFWRACDKSKLCLSVIQQSSHRPVHLFTGLLEKLPEKHIKQIAALRPSADASKQKRAEAFDSMGAYLREHSKELYGPHMQANNCVFHPSGTCSVKFQDPPYLSPKQRPFSLLIAGPSCRPWTRFAGCSDPSSHEDMECWLLWIAEISEAEYDCVIMENSEFFPVDLFVSGMPKHYSIKYSKFGSQDQGWPVRRTRTYCVALNMRTTVWLGSQDAEDRGRGKSIRQLVTSLIAFGRSCAV